MGFLPSFLSFDCFANESREHTVKTSVDLFNKARGSIRIVAGRLGNSFYSDSRTIRALNDSIDKGVSVDIAFYPSPENEAAKDTFVKRIPKVHLISLKAKPSRHWVVVDGKHIRVERQHPDGAVNTRALICKNASRVASEFDAEFEALTNAK